MNNKRKDKDPLFAEVKLTGDEFKQSPSNYAQRTRFLKLVYPNNVTLILPSDFVLGLKRIRIINDSVDMGEIPDD